MYGEVRQSMGDFYKYSKQQPLVGSQGTHVSVLASQLCAAALFDTVRQDRRSQGSIGSGTQDHSPFKPVPVITVILFLPSLHHFRSHCIFSVRLTCSHLKMFKPYSKEEEDACIFPAVFSEHTGDPDALLAPACPVLSAQGCLCCWANPSSLGRPSCSSTTGSPLLFTLC